MVNAALSALERLLERVGPVCLAAYALPAAQRIDQRRLADGLVTATTSAAAHADPRGIRRHRPAVRLVSRNTRRDPTAATRDRLVPAGQLLRGVLIGLALSPFLPVLRRWSVSKRTTAFTGLYLVIGFWAAALAASGNIERLVYLRPAFSLDVALSQEALTDWTQAPSFGQEPPVYCKREASPRASLRSSALAAHAPG